jgi:hypothetical protein
MKIKDTKFVTDLEKQVIVNIINSEYMDATDANMINWGVWSFTATNETKQLAGALGSLVKKGLCFSQDEDNDHACGLTEQGYYWAKNNGICN